MENITCSDALSESDGNVHGNEFYYNYASNTSTEKGNDPTQEIVAISQCAISSIGIIANSMVIIVFVNDRKLRRKIPNIFIINQSCIDLLCSLILLLTTLTIEDYNYTTSLGIWGDLECAIWNSKLFLWGPLVSSTYNLVCLTVERYLELVYPFWHRTHFRMKYLQMAIASCWIFGIGFNAGYMIPTGKIVDGICKVYYLWPSEELKTTFGILTIIIQFIIPFIVLMFCYGKIVLLLSKRINTNIADTNVHNSADVHAVNQLKTDDILDKHKDKFQLARRNTIKTLLIVGCCFIICWSQNQVLFLMSNCGYQMDWNSAYLHYTILMVFLNSTVNPFIYLVNYRDYQSALKKFLHCSYSGSNEIQHGTSSNLSNSNETSSGRRVLV